MSRVVSADCVAWARLCFLGICRRSPWPGRAGFLGITSWLNARSPSLSGIVLRLVPCYDLLCEVCSVVLFCMRPCLNPSLRGRPRTVGRVRARAPERPTPIKSLRSSCGTPSRSIIRITPGRNGQVKGTHRAGREPQGFARRQAANQHRHNSRIVSPFSALGATLQEPGRRTGQRWEPTRAPRQGSKRNGGGRSGSPLFFSCDAGIPL